MDDDVVGATQQYLSFAIHVPVKGDGVPLFIGAGLHVGAKVYPPKAYAREGEYFDAVEAGGVAGEVAVARVVAFADELELAVSVHIGSHHVVEFIG
ncbi:MAG: hypothetical protein BWY72_00984 [Bacteroidetes bacterium ADurb.Bin416]|nr:MAG: hypothetical protein BWY72_00984 [Bacteroidetes bacterium ADurb.Bin416]